MCSQHPLRCLLWGSSHASTPMPEAPAPGPHAAGRPRVAHRRGREGGERGRGRAVRVRAGVPGPHQLCSGRQDAGAGGREHADRLHGRRGVLGEAPRRAHLPGPDRGGLRQGHGGRGGPAGRAVPAGRARRQRQGALGRLPGARPALHGPGARPPGGWTGGRGGGRGSCAPGHIRARRRPSRARASHRGPALLATVDGHAAYGVAMRPRGGQARSRRRAPVLGPSRIPSLPPISTPSLLSLPPHRRHRTPRWSPPCWA